jgi:hypothetical protein
VWLTEGLVAEVATDSIESLLFFLWQSFHLVMHPRPSFVWTFHVELVGKNAWAVALKIHVAMLVMVCSFSWCARAHG